METIFKNRKNSKTIEPHIFVFDFSQRLDLRSPNKHFDFQKLSIYCTWENIRKQYKNNNSCNME